MSKSYEQGRIDALALYGRVCSQQGNCDSCLIKQIRGEDIDCQEFMKTFPAKVLSLLSEMDSTTYTYYNEYVTRFPNCNLSLENLANITCRKAIFEGFVGCEGGDCKACWSEAYSGDVTMVEDDEEDS